MWPHSVPEDGVRVCLYVFALVCLLYCRKDKDGPKETNTLEVILHQHICVCNTCVVEVLVVHVCDWRSAAGLTGSV